MLVNPENILIIIVVFLSYFLVSWVYKRLGVPNLESALKVRNGLRLLNLKHSLGIVLFGVLCFIALNHLGYLVTIVEIAKLYILIPFFILLIASTYVSWNTVKKVDAEDKSHYSFTNAWLYFFVRFTFLLCYEFFFRGVLLFTLLEYFGVIESITLATFAYIIIHLFYSKKEIIGTIPFGIILCYLTIETQSIWYAFLMHLALSAVYEISIFYQLTLKPLKS